jgi:hypothetical protein
VAGEVLSSFQKGRRRSIHGDRHENIIFALITVVVLGTMFVATVVTHPDGLPLAQAEGYLVTAMPDHDVIIAAKGNPTKWKPLAPSSR